MNLNNFRKRLWLYAQDNNIRFVNSGREISLKSLGLSDVRGFTPHLRSVMLAPNTFHQVRSSGLADDPDSLWIYHDMLHVMFYDHCFDALGASQFLERFLEIHLASEAFAVLLLDYHVLSETPGQGLAVEFDPKDWTLFQRIRVDLPHYLSRQFVQALTQLYLSGLGSHFSPSSNEAFEVWAGHERRYAEKQRIYAAQWWSDLNQKPFDNKVPVITKSYIDEAIWELLSLFMGSERTWRNYCQRNKNFKNEKTPENYFGDLKKYVGPIKRLDFRFTDFRSLNWEEVAPILESPEKPNPSQLFLFWQLAASLSGVDLPYNWDERQLTIFRRLHKATNSTPIATTASQRLDSQKSASLEKASQRSMYEMLDTWNETQEILIKASKRLDILPAQSSLLSCFFLP